MEAVAQQPQVSSHFITAYSIAKNLAKEAIWPEDGRCNWQGASLEPIEGQYQVVTRTFGTDLYSGLSGIALFLAEIALRVSDPVIDRTLNGAIANILQQTQEKPSPSAFGVYSGRMGTGYTLWKIGKLVKNDTWKKAGIDMMQELRKEAIGDHEIDIISGVASAIPVLLKVHAEEGSTDLFDLAVKCGDFLLEKATKTASSWSWQTIPGNAGLTGYSHGAAGIALALLELYTQTQKSEYWVAAMRGFQYEREHFVPQQNNWPDLREEAGQSTTPQNRCCGEMWCHGAPGIALSRLRAYQLTGDRNFLQEAQLALDTTYKSVLKGLQNPASASFCLCHGLAGNADILLTGATWLNQPQYVQAAHHVGLLGYELYEKTQTDWPSGVNDPTGKTNGMEPTPGLMLGSAGTGYFYLRLAYPKALDSLLLLN